MPKYLLPRRTASQNSSQPTGVSKVVSTRRSTRAKRTLKTDGPTVASRRPTCSSRSAPATLPLDSETVKGDPDNDKSRLSSKAFEDKQLIPRTDLPNAETLANYKSVLSSAHQHTLNEARLAETPPKGYIRGKRLFQVLDAADLKQVRHSLDNSDDVSLLQATFGQVQSKYKSWRTFYTLLEDADETFVSGQSPEKRAQSASAYWLQRVTIADAMVSHCNELEDRASWDAAKAACFATLSGTEEVVRRLEGDWEATEARLLNNLQRETGIRDYVASIDWNRVLRSSRRAQ